MSAPTPPILSDKSPLGQTEPPQLPPETAPVSEVQMFLTALLTASGTATLERATSMASKWTIGSGSDLRAVPLDHYRAVFGDEEAWFVYRRVRPRILKQKKAVDRLGSPADGVGVVVFVIGVTILAAVARLMQTPSTPEPWNVFANLIYIIFGFMVAAIVFIALFAALDGRSEEEKIEQQVDQELKTAYEKKRE